MNHAGPDLPQTGQEGNPETRLYKTLSFYENAQFPWLPSRVETGCVPAKGNLKLERVLSILEAEANVELPESTWTLAGLRPPVGAPVGDLRIKRRLGYWDGTGISPEPPAPK